MSWTLLLTVVLVLGLSLFAVAARRRELLQMRSIVKDRVRAVRQGSHKAKLQHPVVDLSRCLGCATCVAACPEDGVLEIVHGQAVVVNGARCIGISACERECPVGAIAVTLGDVSERNDIPALDERLEAVGAPGLFLAGEVTAHALIATAIEHGASVGAAVAKRVENEPKNGVLDLLVVGAGPAGLACSLEAKRQGLNFLTIDQEERPGGTVAKYPRRKLVMTQPVDMPLHGRLELTYTKEELVELWQNIATKQQLPIRGGEVFGGLDRDAKGNFVVRTAAHSYTAKNVCLALGRRGIPRKLGIPGEDLAKVSYALLDAGSYSNRRILVVGGGDSAIEAAIGLAEQPGNEVTLSYRKEAFLRIRTRNEQRLAACMQRNRLQILFKSQVVAIHPESVEIAAIDGTGIERWTVPNDDVFVMAGGVPPFELLERSGVSFDASLRPPTEESSEQGTGLVKALAIGFCLALMTLAFALWHSDYYTLPAIERPAHAKHELLRPMRGIGLFLGIGSALLIVANLAYLVRRSPRFKFARGSLQTWMTSHVATGILAFLFALLHGSMSPGDTIGGHAFWGLAVLLVTGAIGRYFYAYIPRAANGRELDLDEVRATLGNVSEDWGHGERKFRERARREVLRLLESRQWASSFFGRLAGLVGGRKDLHRVLTRLSEQARREGIPAEQIKDTVRLARKAHRTALVASHYEDIRALLNSWRYLHRWVAALMVILVVVHIVYSLAYVLFLGGAA